MDHTQRYWEGELWPLYFLFIFPFRIKKVVYIWEVGTASWAYSIHNRNNFPNGKLGDRQEERATANL